MFWRRNVLALTFWRWAVLVLKRFGAIAFLTAELHRLRQAGNICFNIAGAIFY